MTATRRALLLLGVAAGSALFIPDAIAIVAFVLVLVGVGIDLWTVRRTPEIDQTRPGIMWRGVGRAFSVEVATTLPHRIRQPSGASLVISPSTADGRLESEILAVRRGRHHLPAPSIRLEGPLGLGAWRRDAGWTTDVSVYPDMPAAYAIADDVRHGRFLDEGRRSRGPIGLGTEFESIRDYQPDDDIRQVNWKATWRVGRPMSNLWRVEQDREVVCLVDAGRLMAAPLGEMTRLDAAVDAVAAMAAVADEVGDRVGLVVFSDGVLRHVTPKRANGQEVIRALYDIEATGVDSNYNLAFQLVANAKRSFLLILTDLLDEGAGAPLLEAMALLSRHHAVAVGAVRDEDVYSAAVQRPQSESDVYRMAAALDVLAIRRRLVARIERYGAQVIEGPVESFSRACVAAYVRSRRTGRL